MTRWPAGSNCGTTSTRCCRSRVYTYFDIGKVWNRGDAVGESSDESLASAGVGVRFAITGWLSGSLEAGKPLIRRVDAEGDKEWRGFFSFRTEW